MLFWTLTWRQGRGLFVKEGSLLLPLSSRHTWPTLWASRPSRGLDVKKTKKKHNIGQENKHSMMIICHWGLRTDDTQQRVKTSCAFNRVSICSSSLFYFGLYWLKTNIDMKTNLNPYGDVQKQRGPIDLLVTPCALPLLQHYNNWLLMIPGKKHQHNLSNMASVRWFFRCIHFKVSQKCHWNTLFALHVSRWVIRLKWKLRVRIGRRSPKTIDQTIVNKKRKQHSFNGNTFKYVVGLLFCERKCS